MQTKIDKLNAIFSQVLIDQSDIGLWKKFSDEFKEPFEDGTTFLYMEAFLFGNIDTTKITQIREEMFGIKVQIIELLEKKSFEYAFNLNERYKLSEIRLDNLTAKAFFNTDNYFYLWHDGIGFNFTGDRVFDFLMRYYSSQHRGGYPLLRTMKG